METQEYIHIYICVCVCVFMHTHIYGILTHAHRGDSVSVFLPETDSEA